MLFSLFFRPNTFRKPAVISHSQGAPCINASPQSSGCMPVAPPKIHFNLPQICGSGAKGASPNVNATSPAICQLRRKLFNCSDLITAAYLPQIASHRRCNTQCQLAEEWIVPVRFAFRMHNTGPPVFSTQTPFGYLLPRYLVAC